MPPGIIAAKHLGQPMELGFQQRRSLNPSDDPSSVAPRSSARACVDGVVLAHRASSTRRAEAKGARECLGKRCALPPCSEATCRAPRPRELMISPRAGGRGIGIDSFRTPRKNRRTLADDVDVRRSLSRIGGSDPCPRVEQRRQQSGFGPDEGDIAARPIPSNSASRTVPKNSLFQPFFRAAGRPTEDPGRGERGHEDAS